MVDENKHIYVDGTYIGFDLERGDIVIGIKDGDGISERFYCPDTDDVVQLRNCIQATCGEAVTKQYDKVVNRLKRDCNVFREIATNTYKRDTQGLLDDERKLLRETVVQLEELQNENHELRQKLLRTDTVDE